MDFAAFPHVPANSSGDHPALVRDSLIGLVQSRPGGRGEAEMTPGRA
jgi:hypothetical protein